MNSIHIIQNKSEIGAGTRGSSLGIDALKVTSLNQSSNFFSSYSYSTVKNENQMLYEPITTPSAIRIEGISKVYSEISSEVSKTFLNNQFPLVLAADHSSAGGTIAGIKMAFPDKRLGVVWIDAHGDLHSPYTSPTGNVHGMPLATALGEDNVLCKIKEVNEETKGYWEELKNMGGINPKIKAEDLVFFGVRDTESPENQLMDRLGIKNFTVDECRSKGIDKAVSEALDKLYACDIIYISFDVDSMDSEYVSEGTGPPVPNGFYPKEAEGIILRLIESRKVACFEMVEVNPTLDTKNKMANTAFHILEITASHIEKYSLK